MSKEQSDSIKNDIEEIVISSSRIKKRVKNLAKEISRDFKYKNPVFVSILKGSVIFLAELLKEIDIKCCVDFIAVSSYGYETESSGVVKMIMDLRESIKGRNVVLVEDIVDTGLTIAYIKENLLTRKPAEFKVCALLSKKEKRKIPIKIDYKGFEVPDKFVVGYGLDYGESYRNLEYIGTLKPEIYR